MPKGAVSSAFMTKAKDLANRGKLSEAIKTLQEGLRLYPNLVSARVLLGEIYWMSGELWLAKAELERVAKATPDNFAAHRNLAMLYSELKDHDSAIRSCQIVLQANPKDQEMRSLLAGLVPSAGRPIAGTEELDTETLAELYIRQGHREKGLAVLRRLLAKSPANSSLRDRLTALEREGVNKGAKEEAGRRQSSPDTGNRTKRIAHIRRLEEWLAAIRTRRRV